MIQQWVDAETAQILGAIEDLRRYVSGRELRLVGRYQLAVNPPTPTGPDSAENAPNARPPQVTAPVRGPR